MNKGSLYTILWITYLLSLAVLSFDVLIAGLPLDSIIFYAVTNAILVYQMFGVYWLTTAFHSITLVAIAVLYVIFNSLNVYVHIIILATLIAETVFGIFLLMSRYFANPKSQEIISALHALIGLIVVGVMFLIVGFVNNRNIICGVLHMAYMLMFLIIILTPQFFNLSKDVLRNADVANADNQ